MTPAKSLVTFENVSKRFGSALVLDRISLDIQSGEIAVLIGRSGSGKSTLLRCMNYLEPIDSGELVVCGERLTPHLSESVIRALHRNVGIVFQSYNLFPHLTVQRNITIALELARKMPRRDAIEKAHSVLEVVGLVDKIAAYPHELSGGQQQRVAIARSLAMDPALMLFDEVTSALDPILTKEVLHVVKKLASGGMTMVLVTHEMNFAKTVASKVVFINDGTVGEMGSPDILDHPSSDALKQFMISERFE